MKHLRAFKYAFVLTGVAAGLISILGPGIWSYCLPIYAFGLIPLLELLIKPDQRNIEGAEMEMVKQDRVYDFLLYMIVPVQVGMIVLLGWKLSQPGLTVAEIVGKIWATGIGCGVLGINVAHELGHRSTWYEQWMAKILLLTSLYMHFFIEHNRGHHKHVSTPEDPASARRGEWLFTFWFRSVWGSYWSAWEIENKRVQKLGKPTLSLSNEMVVYHLLQSAALAVIAFAFGWQVMLYFVAAAVSGFLLLETVNYIEHYGLLRRQRPDGSYERVTPRHSWNDSHHLSNLALLNLQRHSDHHAYAGRRYQVLRHHDDAPQLPCGYASLVLLALVPPLWRRFMDPRIAAWKAAEAG